MAEKQNIGIIGAGGWGLALAKVFSITHDVTVWVYEEDELLKLKSECESKNYLKGVSLPQSIRYTSSLEEAVDEKDIVILALPSFAFRDTLITLADYVSPKSVFLSVTKGLESGTTRRMSEIAKSVLPKGVEVLSLSGPSHAEEVARLVPTAVVVAGEDIEIAKRIRDVLITPPHLRIYASADHVGVEIGGSVKNIIAIAAGAVDGLGLGDNTKAALITRGLAEIVRFGVSKGANLETFYGLSGLGDLIVTCSSVHSRNRKVGELIAEGNDYESIKSKMKQVAEGVYAAKAVHEYAAANNISMPITSSVYRVLFEGSNAKEELLELMSRSPKEE